MEPYEELAGAIVLQAVKDYSEALKRLKRNPADRQGLTDKAEIESFFHSGWYGHLTKLDPDMLIRKLNEEVK